MTVEIIDVEQGSPEWFAARAGLPTSSEFKTILREGRGGGDSVTRKAYLRRLAGEILTGEPAPEGYSNAFMARGKELEDEARTLFAFMMDVEPQRVGFLKNGRKGASPDSLIADFAGLEIKVAIPAVQIERLEWNRLPPEHIPQVQGNLLVSERETWFFMSYCPKLPPLILPIHRDEAKIKEIAKAVDAFNEELDSLVASIRSYSDLRGALAA
jgi:hypothetical protein